MLEDDEDSGGDDCNDLTDEIHPNATETYYDGVDQNCDDLDDFICLRWLKHQIDFFFC